MFVFHFPLCDCISLSCFHCAIVFHFLFWYIRISFHHICPPYMCFLFISFLLSHSPSISHSVSLLSITWAAVLLSKKVSLIYGSNGHACFCTYEAADRPYIRPIWLVELATILSLSLSLFLSLAVTLFLSLCISLSLSLSLSLSISLSLAICSSTIISLYVSLYYSVCTFY